MNETLKQKRDKKKKAKAGTIDDGDDRPVDITAKVSSFLKGILRNRKQKNKNIQNALAE